MFRGFLVCLTGVLLSTLSQNTLSASIQCPEPNEEYESILRKLKDFEARLAPQAECRSLQTELSDLRLFYSNNMTKFKKGLKRKGEDNEINEEEAEALSNYSVAIAEKISSIIAALDQDNGNCISKEKQPSFLSSLASIARSATGLVGSFSGPYELPVRIGGNLFAGVLLGIDQLIQGNPKYDFNDPDLHQLFVKNLCIYHDIRQEIQNTLEPARRLRMYIEIVELLNEKERVILEACRDTSRNCEEYQSRFRAKINVASLVDELNDQIDQAADKAESSWAYCAMLSDIVFHSARTVTETIELEVGPPSPDPQPIDPNEGTSVAGDDFLELDSNGNPLSEPKDIFEEIINEVKKTPDNAQALKLMEETYEKITSNGFIPKRLDCWDLSEEEAAAKIQRTRGIIRDISRMATEHFDFRLRLLLYPSEDENVHEKRNYALWLDQTYKKRFWAFNEIVHMLQLMGPEAPFRLSYGGLAFSLSSNEELHELEKNFKDVSDSARQQIRLMLTQLDGRVLGDLAPQFISWNVKQANQSLGLFEKRRKQEQTNIRAKLNNTLQLNLRSDTSIPDLLKVVQCPVGGEGLPNEVCSNFASNISELLNQYGLVRNSIGAASVYCDFFSRAGTLNDKLLSACSSGEFSDVQKKASQLLPEKEAYEKYIDWCHLENKIDGDNARDITQRIKSFVDDTKKRIPPKTGNSPPK